MSRIEVYNIGPNERVTIVAGYIGYTKIVGECDCLCHISPEAKHEVACCSPCTHCKKNIKINNLTEHEKTCHG